MGFLLEKAENRYRKIYPGSHFRHRFLIKPVPFPVRKIPQIGQATCMPVSDGAAAHCKKVSVKSSSVQKRRVRRNLDAAVRIKNQFVVHIVGAFQGSNSWTFSGWLRSISAAVDISQDK